MDAIKQLTQEQYNLNFKNRRNAWNRLKEVGAIPNNGKKYCLHHVDESLRHNNIDRYIQWNLYDLEVMEDSEHKKLHNIGHIVTEESKKKISEAHKNYVFTEEHRHKLSDVMKGKCKSEEHKKHISEARKGIVFTEEHRRKLSEAKKGKTHKGRSFTEEQRKEMSMKLKGRTAYNKGISMSEEQRRKISETLSGYKQSTDTCNKRSESMRIYWQNKKIENF